MPARGVAIAASPPLPGELAGGSRAADEQLVVTEEALVDLYLRGLICDSGIRRGGEIAWVVRVHCDRCSGQRVATTGVRGPDRLPCDDGLRSLTRVRVALRGKKN